MQRAQTVAAVSEIELLQNTIGDFEQSIAESEAELKSIEDECAKPNWALRKPLADLTERKNDLIDDVQTFKEMIATLRTALAAEMAHQH